MTGLTSAESDKRMRSSSKVMKTGQVCLKFGGATSATVLFAFWFAASLFVAVESARAQTPPTLSCPSGTTFQNISNLATVYASPNTYEFPGPNNGIFQAGTAWDINMQWPSNADPGADIVFDFGSLQLNNPAITVNDVDADPAAWTDVVVSPWAISTPSGTLAYTTSGLTATGVDDVNTKYFFASDTSTTNTQFIVNYSPGANPAVPVAQHILVDIWHCHPEDADLSINVIENNVTATTGQQFTVTITNSGPDDAHNVTAEITVPACATSVSKASGTGTLSGSGPYTWTVGSTINNGQSRSINIAYDATGCTVGSTIDFTGQVTASDEFDPDSTVNNGVIGEDDDDTESETVQTPEPDISVFKFVDNNTPDQNAAIYFYIGVSNGGTADATSVILAEVLPSGFTYTSHNASAGTFNSTTEEWDIGGMTVGQSENLFIHGTATGAVGSTECNNVSVLTALPSDSNSGNNSDSDCFTIQCQRRSKNPPLAGVKMYQFDGVGQSSLSAFSGAAVGCGAGRG